MIDDLGIDLIAVSLDASPEPAREWVTDEVRYPVVIDASHVTADRYGIVNVPMSVWIGADDRVAKPPSDAPGDDRFRDFTGLDSSVHHDALRHWVRTGEVTDLRLHERPRTADEQTALAERRLAALLLAEGHAQAARSHLEAAKRLSPKDWTIQRAGIALMGGDPFMGDEFLAFWEAWDADGRRY